MELIESSSLLELVSPMPAGARVALVVLGLIPLIAPYELLVRPSWSDYVSLAFAFAVLISAGAVGVGFTFAFGGLAGLSSRLVLDAAGGELVHTAVAPVVPRRTRSYPLSKVEAVEVGTREREDGPPSHALTFRLSDGVVLKTGPISSREVADTYLERVTRFLAWHRAR